MKSISETGGVVGPQGCELIKLLASCSTSARIILKFSWTIIELSLSYYNTLSSPTRDLCYLTRKGSRVPYFIYISYILHILSYKYLIKITNYE